jgi:hypothetical protein
MNGGIVSAWTIPSKVENAHDALPARGKPSISSHKVGINLWDDSMGNAGLIFCGKTPKTGHATVGRAGI